METKSCGKCGSALNTEGVCPACTSANNTIGKTKSKKMVIILVSLVLVAVLTLTTVFVVLPMFNKEEEYEKVYTSGTEGVAFENSKGTFFITAAGLCAADEDKEVSILRFDDADSGQSEPIQTYTGDNMVLVGDKVYMSQGQLYELNIVDDSTCESAVWLSYEDMDKSTIDMGEYDYVSKESFLSYFSNMQYLDGYIYYSRAINVDKYEYGTLSVEEVGNINIIGRINVETKNMEIVKIIEPSEYFEGFDYVVYDEWVYYNCGSIDEFKLRKCRVDGSEDQVVCEGYPYNMTVYKDKLYFFGESMCDIVTMNLDGSDRKTLVEAEERVSAFTIDSKSNAIYYSTQDSVYKISLDDLSSRKVIDGKSPVNLTCLDSKLYMSFSLPIYSGYSSGDDGMEEMYGTKEKPLIAGLCYDTESNTARVAYTYLDKEVGSTGKQRHFWKTYNSEEYGLYAQKDTSVIFEIY